MKRNICLEVELNTKTVKIETIRTFMCVGKRYLDLLLKSFFIETSYIKREK